MSALTELTNKLKEIFQIDRADLDFGIYRILNSRSEQIERYLTHTLPQVANKKLKEHSDIQNAVYRHLLTFFGRYYEEGDFISQRRYKGDTYAIPYNGEEVLLHWANKDQYYTKSGENFANYRFKLSDGREVFFKLNQADTAKDNQKDNEAKRFFTLVNFQIDDNENAILPISQSDDGQVLTILFDYKAFPKSAKPTQDKILADDLATILANEIVATNWQLLTEKSPTEKNKERTLLEKHLSDYTAKNTADYFIHKDLGGFLKRELDFYIKNEVMNLDDIDNAQTADNIAQNLRLIQTLRAIAFDIIAFLAQLENFQKRLWEKKKFVADCHYLITLDNIPSHFYDEIFANEKQIKEWQNLYGADNIKRENVHLVVNTSLFNHAFQAKLLATFDDLDNQIGGTIIHGDNFQALNLLQAKYQGQVKCIYIDPPYNKGYDGFIYKDSYKNSSWLSMIYDRVSIGKKLISENGALSVSIDDDQDSQLMNVLDDIFGRENLLGHLIWNRNHSAQAGYYKIYHEYICNYAKNKNKVSIALSGEGELEAGAMKKPSNRHKLQEFSFPAGTNFYADDGVEFSGRWGGAEFVELVSGRMIAENKKLKFPVTLKSAWTQFGQMTKFFNGETVFDTKGQLVLDFFFTSTGKLKYKKERNSEIPASVHNFGTASQSTNALTNILGFEPKHTPKPVALNEFFANYYSQENDLILDYFAGSGTTAHAVINLNREDNGNRKFILVEQGEYFNTVLKPRIQKVIFAKEYKDGKPVADKDGQFGGISQIVKVLKLESYEDTLNNLQLKASDLFDRLPENTQKDYVLNYMLNIESRESLLNVADFAKPFDYELNITTDSAGAYNRQKIDLVETFNYLIGANILGITDRREKEGVVEIECQLPHQTGDDKALIFWRDCEKVGYDDIKTMFAKRSINPKESQYQEIYINGDHTLDTVWENADGTQNTLKIKSIEQAFLDLMFGEI